MLYAIKTVELIYLLPSNQITFHHVLASRVPLHVPFHVLL
jgi:hypothetical protein